jgi:hypothetical protein
LTVDSAGMLWGLVPPDLWPLLHWISMQTSLPGGEVCEGAVALAFCCWRGWQCSSILFQHASWSFCFENTCICVHQLLEHAQLLDRLIVPARTSQLPMSNEPVPHTEQCFFVFTHI